MMVSDKSLARTGNIRRPLGRSCASIHPRLNDAAGELILYHIKAIISELSDAAVLIGAERQVLRGRCGVLECIQEIASLLY